MKLSSNLILFMPSIDGGGVEKNLIIIANYLIKKLKKVTVITYDNRFRSKFDKKVNVISFKKTSSGTKKYFKYFICLLLLIREFFKKKQILVLSFQANIYVLFLSSILNFKTIVRSNSSPTGWTKNYIKKFIFKFFFKFASKIIVNSYEFKKLIDSQFKIKSYVIYNPLNKKEILKLSKKKISNFNFFKKKHLNLIHVARFTDQKDHITLLHALNNLKDKLKFKLLIMGYGENKKKFLNLLIKIILERKLK